ncbi:MAG: hypothetical protein MMC23_003221 [Stictis urceolatum]|nr:hypothetical protein [Stictis urceolata]
MPFSLRNWFSRIVHPDRTDAKLDSKMESRPLSKESCALQGRGMNRTEALRKKLVFPQSPMGDKDVKSKAGDAPFFKHNDEDTILEFKKAFDHEMKILQEASPTAEAAGAKTHGGYGQNRLTPSKLMYGKDFNEVNRTIVGVLALKWLVNNQYDTFTAFQPEKVKLTRESFETIRTLILYEIRTSDELYFVIVSMIINDLGKKDRPPETGSEEAPGRRASAATPNHDELIYEDACNGKIELLNEFRDHKDAELHRWLLLGLKLGAKLNVPQFAQAENVPASLTTIKEVKNQPRALDFKILEIVLDVAGAQGHVDSRCACAMLEPTWQTFAASRQLLSDIAEHKINECDAYNKLLEGRAELLANTGFKKLSTEVPEQRALLRLVTMGRALESKGSADIIADAFYSLSAEQREKLVEGLAVTGIKDGTAIIPYYSPSLFANIFRRANERKFSDERKVPLLAALMRFLVRVYRDTKPVTSENKGMVVECKLSFIQDMIISDAFLDKPETLDKIAVGESHYTHAFDEWIR